MRPRPSGLVGETSGRTGGRRVKPSKAGWRRLAPRQEAVPTWHSPRGREHTLDPLGGPSERKPYSGGNRDPADTHVPKDSVDTRPGRLGNVAWNRAELRQVGWCNYQAR